MLQIRGRRPIRRLEDLGYIVRPGPTRWEVEIPNPRLMNNICVAGFVIPGGAATGMLTIQYINTNVDRRPRTRRPYASDILLGFWKFTVNLPVASLTCLSFYMVQEPSVCAAVLQVYQDILQLPALCRTIDIPGIMVIRPGLVHAHADREALALLVQTKFGNMATRILTEYDEAPRNSRGSGLRFRIVPLMGDMGNAELEERVAAGVRLTVENICHLFDFEVYFCWNPQLPKVSQ